MKREEAIEGTDSVTERGFWRTSAGLQKFFRGTVDLKARLVPQEGPMGTSPAPFLGSSSSYADLFKEKSPPKNNEAQKTAYKMLFTAAGNKSTAHRVNGCLPQAEARPKIVIEPRMDEESVIYRANHDLICKFMGIRPSLNFLHSWIRQNWEPHGEYSLWFISNGYFIVSFSSLADINRALESEKKNHGPARLFVQPWRVGFDP